MVNWKIQNFVFLLVIFLCSNDTSGHKTKLPTVLISTLIRNKAHTLPYFLSYLENLNYPKDRISLCFRSDHNEDNSITVTETWINSTKDLYYRVVHIYSETPSKRKDESSMFDWTAERFSDVIRYKEEALQKAKDMWVDYLFFLDADVFLTNPNVLEYLVSLKLPIVAPLLKSEDMYSNFWASMRKKYYYIRTDEYTPIIYHKKIGEHMVPMVHSAVLVDVNLADIDSITFNKTQLQNTLKKKNQIYDEDDDIITFAVSANVSEIPMYVSNKHHFGYILVPLESEDSISKDYEQLRNILVMIVNEHDEIQMTKSMQKFAQQPKKDSLGFSKIIMINLERRPERRLRMENNFNVLGLDVEYFAAVDGNEIISCDWIEEKGIEFMRHLRRRLSNGEIACFMSHYLIWQQMVKENLEQVLILEDDVRFDHFFRDKAKDMMDQANKTGMDWDLIYFGRELKASKEQSVTGARNLVETNYSWLTLGYVLTLKGAKKLLDSKPLQKLVPVDDYLAIMYNKHPIEEYMSEIPTRNLISWSTDPAIIYPTHYEGDKGYISDTSKSSLCNTPNEAKKKEDKADYATNGRLPAGSDIKMPSYTLDIGGKHCNRIMYFYNTFLVPL